MRELEEQSFDSEFGEFVYDFKNYDVGDVVHFRDKIVRLEYDRKEDVTYFAFVSAYEADRVVEWPFRVESVFLCKKDSLKKVREPFPIPLG